MSIDAEDWKIRYVQHWSHLTDGQSDPHKTWGDAEAEFRKHGTLDPEAVAEANFDSKGA
jgi:hypothetical protein